MDDELDRGGASPGPSGTRRAWGVLVLAGAALGLAACQSVRTVPEGARAAPGGYTEAQLRVLRDAGFRETSEGWELGLNVKILFGVDDDRVNDDAQGPVVRLGRQLREVGIERLRVEGYTDNTGTRAHNEQLSLRRATAVGLVLRQAGFEPAQLQLRGMGADFPVADNASGEGRAENRRVALVVPPQP